MDHVVKLAQNIKLYPMIGNHAKLQCAQAEHTSKLMVHAQSVDHIPQWIPKIQEDVWSLNVLKMQRCCKTDHANNVHLI